MPAFPELVLFSTDALQVEALRSQFKSVEGIRVEEGNGLQVTARCKLDAMWMTPMMAYEAGIPVPLPPHVATIFPMPADRQKRGLPPLMVTGVTLVPGRQYSAEYLSRITAKALTEAVVDFNKTNTSRIRRIGAVPGALGLDKLSDVEAFNSFRQAFGSPESEGAPSLDGLSSRVLAGSGR